MLVVVSTPLRQTRPYGNGMRQSLSPHHLSMSKQ